MPYPEPLIAPMRAELTRLGIAELRTPAAVDAAVRDTRGTLLIVVNAICGCAAGKARPGLALALAHPVRPDRPDGPQPRTVLTSTGSSGRCATRPVFAGADVDATDRARRYFTGYPPSSPSMGLLRDGRLVWMLEPAADREPRPGGDCGAADGRLRRALRARAHLMPVARPAATVVTAAAAGRAAGPQASRATGS